MLSLIHFCFRWILHNKLEFYKTPHSQTIIAMRFCSSKIRVQPKLKSLRNTKHFNFISCAVYKSFIYTCIYFHVRPVCLYKLHLSNINQNKICFSDLKIISSCPLRLHCETY